MVKTDRETELLRKIRDAIRIHTRSDERLLRRALPWLKLAGEPEAAAVARDIEARITDGADVPSLTL